MEFSKERTAGNLRAIRGLRNYSQQELADRSGVSLDSIKGYEKASSVMSLKAATLLAGALDCSLDSLVAEIDV